MTINKTTQYTTDPNTIPVDTSTGSQILQDALNDSERITKYVTLEQFGAVGDGVTDDTAAIESAFADGRPVAGARSAVYRITSALSFGTFISFMANGSSFLFDFSVASPSYALTLSSGSRVDNLNISIPAGAIIDRVLLLSGSNKHAAERIDITSSDQQNNRNAASDAAIHVTATNSTINHSSVVNFDNGYVLSANDFKAGRLDFSGFVRGIYFDNIAQFEIDDVIGRTTSPNASESPGHNGLLFEGSSSGHISRVDVEGAGEHGIRFGGGGGGCSDIHINYLRSHNNGGCGLKLRPNTGETHTRITFDTVACSDNGTTFGPNQEGMLLERIRQCYVGYAHIFSVNKTSACARGIRVNNAGGLVIGNALIDNCDDQGILLENTDDNGTTFTNLTDIHIKATINGGNTHGSTILTDNIELRAIYLDFDIRNAAGYGFNVVGSGTFMTLSEFRVRGDDNTSGTVDISSTIGGNGFVEADIIDSLFRVTYVPSNSTTGFLQAFNSDVGGSYSQRCVIRGDGDLENVNNSYGALSDKRLKEDVRDMSAQWDDVKSLTPRKFFNKLSGDEQVGLVAQEVKNTSPGLVRTLDNEEAKRILKSAYPESSEEDIEGMLSEEPLMSIKYSVINMKLLKVVQELQDRIEVLESK